MTCIVGVRTAGGVLLAGDALGASGCDGSVRRDVKVFKLNREVACGYTSSYRMGQILRFHISPPPVGGDEFEWAVVQFIPEIRAAFRDHGFSEIRNNEESAGTFLLAARGRLFQVNGDYQVGENVAPYDAVGCGASYALGALHALHGPKVKPRLLLKRALLAAQEFSLGVRGPFSYVATSS